MQPLRIELWTWDAYERCWEPTRTLRAGTFGQAVRKARAALGTVVTTEGCYYRDVPKGGWAEVARRSGKVLRVDPDVEIAPSVGELG